MSDGVTVDASAPLTFGGDVSSWLTPSSPCCLREEPPQAAHEEVRTEPEGEGPHHPLAIHLHGVASMTPVRDPSKPPVYKFAQTCVIVAARP